MRPVIIDTDLGTDVDDVLAISMRLGSREIEVIGITTVYGDTVLRAQLAAKLPSMVDRSARPIAIVPGAENALSGRPVWWAGHEGKHHNDLSSQRIERQTIAAQYLVDVTRQHLNVEILAIGPLTNIASDTGRRLRSEHT